MHKMTLREAVAEICRWSIWIDTDGKIHTTGDKHPPREVTDRLEEAGFGSGGEEWRRYVHEMLHPDEANRPDVQKEAPSVEDAVLAKLRGGEERMMADKESVSGRSSESAIIETILIGRTSMLCLRHDRT